MPAVLTALLFALSTLAVPVSARAAIAPEPGTATLTDAAVFQAVVVDLDGDRTREIVALVRPPNGLMSATAWRQTDGTWAPVGEPTEVQIPGAGPLGWAGTPARLLVRTIEGVEVLSIVRQPRAGEPDLAEACCLVVDDLVLDDGRLRLVPRTGRLDAMDALHVVDLDGDGTDELVASRSLPPLGDISFRTATAVLRWNGTAFDVTAGELPVGSGDTPFLLGDSDGVPGDELAIAATLGRPELHRLRLGPDDTLLVDDAGIVADGAAAVPVGRGRGVAVAAASGELSVHAWPPGTSLGPALGSTALDGSIVGHVRLGATERLAVRAGAQRLDLLALPDLSPHPDGPVAWSAAGMAFASGGPVSPFVGTVPGGGPDGGAAIAFGGRLVTSATGSGVLPFPSLPGAQPIGLAGVDRSTLAVLHGPSPLPRLDPRGGRLDPPYTLPGSAITVAPFSLAASAEPDGTPLEPPTSGTVVIGSDGALAIGRGGFRATLDAPPGSRVYVAGSDPSVIASIAVVPDDGRLQVPLVPPPVQTEGPHRFSVAVTTPTGHGHLATWETRVLDAPPALVAAATTPIASGEVQVSGRTEPYASVAVDGEAVAVAADGTFETRVSVPPWPTDLTVSARDPFGNTAAQTVSGVGWFDYRALPWLAIAGGVLAIAAVRLFLRVPAPRPRPRPADDDAVLEEVEPD